MNEWNATTLLNHPILMGDNTIPGLEVPPEIKEVLPDIFSAADSFGLDYYPTIIEWLTHDGMSEVAAYNGFPQRIPHWSFGMAYEEIAKEFEFGMGRILELVINTLPCRIYCMNSNSFTDNVKVIGHALGHNDFFKNNVWFKPTNTNMMNEFGNNRTRVLELEAKWGEEKVQEFIEYCYSIRTLIDPANAWTQSEYREIEFHDKPEYQFPRRLKVPEGHDYMEEWMNPKVWIEDEWARIKIEDTKKSLGIVDMFEKDLVKFLLENAPLKPWEQTVLRIIYEEAMYFLPQGMTKMLNEGWASLIDLVIMARIGIRNTSSVEYAHSKAQVLGGRYSQNPYKLGYELLLDIEDRWNKGKFGKEYETCKDNKIREDWDLQLGLGHQKIFQVREQYNDVTALAEFFTEDFCKKHQYFTWTKFPSGEPGVEAEYRIVDRDWKKSRNFLIQRYLNRGRPDIRLVDSNGRGKNVLVLQHNFDGRNLQSKFARDTLRSVGKIWRNPTALLTKNLEGKDHILYCEQDIVKNLSRGDWLKI